MSVHVRYETPEDVSNKIYELVQACNGGRIKRGSNEVTKVALRKTAAFVVLAEDVNPPELVNHIPLICDDNSIPFGYVPSQEFLAKEAGMETGVKAASLAIMDVPKAAQEMLDEVLELVASNAFGFPDAVAPAVASEFFGQVLGPVRVVLVGPIKDGANTVMAGFAAAEVFLR